MQEHNAQKLWDEYYERIRKRRISEARKLWESVEESGRGSDTDFWISFRHFGNDEASIHDLANQLSEQYRTEVVKDGTQDEYWLCNGTTRPDVVGDLDSGRVVDWVSFMCDVARSYACVFSTWTLTDPTRSQTFSSESFDC